MRVLISSETGIRLSAALKEDIITAIEATLKALKVTSKLKDKEVSVFLCSDATMQGINKDTRGKNKPTNVLSFPFLDVDLRSENLPQKIFDIQIGEIICSIDTMRREAKEQKKLLSHHLQHLFVHSTLHLFGYDHMNENEAESMESLEVEILKKLGINNPY
jgi:probable rRNA maturation factor